MSISTFCICGIFALLLVMFLFQIHDRTYDFDCEHCGYEFDADEVEIYLASEDDGLSYRFYDACDCPNCSCQNILAERLCKEDSNEII